MSIAIRDLEQGLMFDCSRSFYPSRMFAHTRGESQLVEPSSFYFGYVVDGEVTISTDIHQHSFPLQAGCYFGLSGQVKVRGDGRVAIIERLGYRGLPQFGGPVEKHGRLLYIDHCRSTLLISPARRGDPCLNLLSFPPSTLQTLHIHPTIRLGVVASGQGACVEPGKSNHALAVGRAFMIDEGAPHSFHTDANALCVIAYHPDTDWGPTDENHPMLNRTYRQV